MYVCACVCCCPPTEASLDYPDHEKDQMFALDTLAAYFVQLARSEKEKTRRREFFTKVWGVAGVGAWLVWGVVNGLLAKNVCTYMESVCLQGVSMRVQCWYVFPRVHHFLGRVYSSAMYVCTYMCLSQSLYVCHYVFVSCVLCIHVQSGTQHTGITCDYTLLEC